MDAGMSESKIEEIIAVLWSLLCVGLIAISAPTCLVWIVAIKALSDHICSIGYAICEIKKEAKWRK
jgi:hypothetical protein